MSSAYWRADVDNVGRTHYEQEQASTMVSRLTLPRKVFGKFLFTPTLKLNRLHDRLIVLRVSLKLYNTRYGLTLSSKPYSDFNTNHKVNPNPHPRQIGHVTCVIACPVIFKESNIQMLCTYSRPLQSSPQVVEWYVWVL